MDTRCDEASALPVEDMSGKVGLKAEAPEAEDAGGFGQRTLFNPMV